MIFHQLWHGASKVAAVAAPKKKHKFEAGLLTRKAWRLAPEEVGRISTMGRVGRALGGSLRAGYGASFGGQMLWAVPQAGFALAMAPRGQKVSAAVGSLATGIGSFAGGMLFGLPGALLGGAVFDEMAASKVGAAVQRMAGATSSALRVNMGQGGFQDNEVAYTMRQAAAREMAGSLLNARHYLGNEATLFHS